MNIQVVSAKDGRHELITLVEPVTIRRSEKINLLICADGMEHWFRLDGLYDGWGLQVETGELSPDEARAFLDAVVKDHEFPDEGDA